MPCNYGFLWHNSTTLFKKGLSQPVGASVSHLRTEIPFNPFTVGGAINDPLGRGFFGREKVFNFVRNQLDVEQRAPMLLLGQRRIGKSSILRQLPQHLPPHHVCVYFDLQGKATMSLDQVLYGLSRAIADTLEMAYPEREKANEEQFLSYIDSAVAKLGDSRRLVLLLDEFDVIDKSLIGRDAAAERFIPYLGELSSNRREIGLVLVVGRKSEELSETFNSAILKDAVQMRIGRLNEYEVNTLVRTLAGSTLHLSDQAITSIFKLAAGHPFCTQILCHTLWRRFAGLKGDLTARDIAASMGEALKLGTNGINWIYDGLVTPEQRLFLSALSEAHDPNLTKRAKFNTVLKILREKKLVVGNAPLDRAVQELRSWDVIEGNAEKGFRFVVPMIGSWIRRERPVSQLEDEPRWAYPRAWKFYELALDSEERGDLDSAIQDYLSSLQENPVFLSAQKGLASALRRRARGQDLNLAVEAWERVLELDPESPQDDLLEALLLALEAADNPAVVRSHYRRIQELDSGSVMRKRAHRNIALRASTSLASGDTFHLEYAIEYYELLGDLYSCARAKALIEKHRQIDTLATFSGLIFLLMAVALGFTRWSNELILLRIFLAASSGMLLTWPDVTAKDPKITLARSGMLFWAVGIVVGSVLWKYLERPWWSVASAGTVALLNLIMIPELATNDINPRNNKALRDWIRAVKKRTLKFIIRSY